MRPQHNIYDFVEKQIWALFKWPGETSRSPSICMDSNLGAQQQNQDPQPNFQEQRELSSPLSYLFNKKASLPTMVLSHLPFRTMKPTGPRGHFQVYSSPSTLIWVHESWIFKVGPDQLFVRPSQKPTPPQLPPHTGPVWEVFDFQFLTVERKSKSKSCY